MPAYCFVCEKCGNSMTVFAGIKRRPKRMACAECGAECIRDYHAEQSGMDNGDTWTLTGGFVNSRHEKGSLSRAIHNDQVPEQMALDKQRGVNLGVEWIPDGRGMARPHFKSKRARDSWDRAHGFVSESHY